MLETSILTEFDAAHLMPDERGFLSQEPFLKMVSVGDINDCLPKPPTFVWDGYVPRGVVTLLSAHGGTGKSMVALMLAVSSALGRPIFEVATARSKTLFCSLEDSAEIVRWRLSGICKAWSIKPRDLEPWLTIVDGTQSPELFASESRGTGQGTTTFMELDEITLEQGTEFLIVDNASDAFGGDEIQRRQVRAFMRLLGDLAKRNDAGVLLLAHVDKQTSRKPANPNDEGYSGSTAWHNSARSRLFMSVKNAGELTLEHQKSNFGKRREPISLIWRDGHLPELLSDSASFESSNLRADGRIQDQKAADLLRLMAEYEQRGQYCSTKSTSPTNPYKVFLPDPIFKKMRLNREDVARLFTQFQRAGWIEPMAYQNNQRQSRERWALTKSGSEWVGLTAPTALTAQTSTVPEHSAHDASRVALTAPTCVGGMGGESARKLDDFGGGA